MEPQNSTSPATTTRMPRIVGYQRVLSICSWARISVVIASSSGSQAALVVDDRLDLLLGQDAGEVRHSAGRDPARAVLLVRRLAARNPVVLILRALGSRELAERGSTGEVRAVRAAAHRAGQRSHRLRRVEERALLRLLRLRPDALQVVHEVVDALLVEDALAALHAPRRHRRARTPVGDDVVDLFPAVT